LLLTAGLDESPSMGKPEGAADALWYASTTQISPLRRILTESLESFMVIAEIEDSERLGKNFFLAL